MQIPLNIREKQDLTPGTKMIVMMTEDAVVLRKAEPVFEFYAASFFLSASTLSVLSQVKSGSSLPKWP